MVTNVEKDAKSAEENKIAGGLEERLGMGWVPTIYFIT